VWNEFKKTGLHTLDDKVCRGVPDEPYGTRR